MFVQALKDLEKNDNKGMSPYTSFMFYIWYKYLIVNVSCDYQSISAYNLYFDPVAFLVNWLHVSESLLCGL